MGQCQGWVNGCNLIILRVHCNQNDSVILWREIRENPRTQTSPLAEIRGPRRTNLSLPQLQGSVLKLVAPSRVTSLSPQLPKPGQGGLSPALEHDVAERYVSRGSGLRVRVRPSSAWHWKCLGLHRQDRVRGSYLTLSSRCSSNTKTQCNRY